jgi:hypothetical protein
MTHPEFNIRSAHVLTPIPTLSNLCEAEIRSATPSHRSASGRGVKREIGILRTLRARKIPISLILPPPLRGRDGVGDEAID